jgi:hypothetical protein
MSEITDMEEQNGIEELTQAFVGGILDTLTLTSSALLAV